VILYHRTNRRAARAILGRGFRDATGSYLTSRRFRGVWFSNQPLDVNAGAEGDRLLRVVLPIPLRELRVYEWVEQGKPYREWLLPAALVNARRRWLVVVPPFTEEVPPVPDRRRRMRSAWRGE
jgi:hypothetical protein